ncbi:MAG: peptide ABC transporter substrate-binding protein [Treponema sp.]|jgi:peptide/nickel transport system substrate-binding protein/oligopeptide transport system substrate-binding protein|nr:peptide ABC transporter substrate-binding protein [Treponema sp.]
MRQSFRFFFILVIFTLFLGACQSPPPVKAPPEIPAPPEAPVLENPEELSPGPDTAETRPRTLQRDELTISFGKADVELDPRKSYIASEAQLFTGLYEGLFSYHPVSLEPVPGAAEKWEVSEDKKTWTFTIRNNAAYWNGDNLRAEDFRAAWISLLDPKRESPYSGLFDVIQGAKDYRTGKVSNPSTVGIKTEGDKTLIISLASPASFFPLMLCHHSFSPVHPSMLEKEDWSAGPPLSNGPFYILEQDFSEDGLNKLVLAKNSYYWDSRRVNLNRITILYTEDNEEASALWNSGQARWIAGDVNLETLTDRSGIMVNPMFATHYYFIRSAEKPWSDHRVRRALVLALPWEEIRQGYYLPATTLIYPIQGYPKIEGLTHTDVAEALRLLEEAGFPKGEGLPELILRIGPSQEAARIGELMAVTWKEKLGAPARIEVVPYRQYLNSLKQDGYTVGSSSWIGDFADPYTFLQIWRRDSNLNDARLDDMDYEALIEKSMTQEGKERLTTLAEAEKLLLDRGTIIPISYSPALNIVDTGELDGWYPNALDIHPFKYLAFKGYRPLPGVTLLLK